MDEVERGGFKPTRKKVVLREHDVAEALCVNELSGGVEHCVVDVGSHDFSFWTDSLAQQSQPADRPATDVEGARSTTVPDLVEEAATTRLPHSRLQLKPLQLRGLICQQVGLRRQLQAPSKTASQADTKRDALARGLLREPTRGVCAGTPAAPRASSTRPPLARAPRSAVCSRAPQTFRTRPPIR